MNGRQRERGVGDEAWLRRLAVVGVALPVAFIVGLQLMRPHVFHRFWPERSVQIIDLLTVLAALAFGLTMFWWIDRGHRLVLTRNRELSAASERSAALVERLERRRAESDAVARLLLDMARERSSGHILPTLASHARRLTRASEAGLCLDAAACSGLVDDLGRRVGLAQPAPPPAGWVCAGPDGVRSCSASGEATCERAERRDTGHLLRVSLPAAHGILGHLWVHRRDADFTDDERDLLRTLADIAVVALDRARLRDQERRAAMLAERVRIAREMHDGLAQILGVTHLRLQALQALRARLVAGEHRDAALDRELGELEILCQEGYRDVREGILCLREAGRNDRPLLEGLAAYVDKFTRSSGIPTRLDVDPGGVDPIPPSSEAQLMRVIQEALTNVRKHSGAASTVVRVRQDESWTTFEIEDDGKGFDPYQPSPDGGRGGSGYGLRSLRERADLMRGWLDIESSPGQGTRVVVGVPRVQLASTRTAPEAGS